MCFCCSPYIQHRCNVDQVYKCMEVVDLARTRMAVYVHHPTERIPGITISLGESVNIPTQDLGQLRKPGRHARSVSEANGLPPAVAAVPHEHIRGYVHSKRVNNYLVGSTLGEGSFAKVKEGFHVLVGEKVAMKIIDKKKAQQDPYVAKNFRREAKLLQMVRHPNILQLFEVIETETSFYLITELCSGGELMKYIYKKQKLDENETRKFMRQIVSAIDHLHKAGIIHRDLKVENMLLDSNMDIKIIDFGLSNEEYIESENGQIHCNTQCGSPAYAAPELLGHKEYSKEVDIWSIGVNMYAMLTGCLPYTVEPFNITALHAKMLENKMNPIPDHLSSDCKHLLQCLLRSNPSERMKMAEIMSHPWMNEGHHLPFEPHTFPNKLKLYEINDEIVDHMVHTLKVRESVEDLKQELLTNRATLASAVYNLLEARLKRYLHQNVHFRRKSRPKRFSRDQGFYEAEDDDDTSSIASVPLRPRHSRQHAHRRLPEEEDDTSSILSVPLRPRYSRQHRRLSRNDTVELTKKDRPISFPPKSTEEAMTEVHAPSSYAAYVDRRKSMPTAVLEREIATFSARKKEKEVMKRQQQHSFGGRKASTLPRRFSMCSHPKEHAKPHQERDQATKPLHRTQSPQDPYEYDLPAHHTTEVADLSPVRPPTVHIMTRNGYSHSHALNQIRQDLNNTLHPPGLKTKAWHSNPSTRTSSRDPSRHGSRNPSHTPSRAPSGSSIRTPMSGSSHLDIIDDDVEDLMFHEVESHTLVISEGDQQQQRRRAFSIGAGSGSSGTMEEEDHLPNLLPSPRHGHLHSTRSRQRTMSDVSEKRNGFLHQAITFEFPTDLDVDGIVQELVKTGELLKMRDLVSSRGILSGVLKGIRIRVQIKKDRRGTCHIAFQWMSGGDLKSYQDICDSFIQRTQLR